MAKTYIFRTETYNKPSNPSKPNEKFESKKAELYPVEYRDILNNCLVKLTLFSNIGMVITLKEGGRGNFCK